MEPERPWLNFGRRLLGREDCRDCRGDGTFIRSSPCKACNGGTFSKTTPCNGCGGSGCYRGKRTCNKCSGSGKYVMTNTCNACHGSGNYHTTATCRACKGSGKYKKDDSWKFKGHGRFS
eukprot:1137589-Pelagomonas_calceolata.AAC.1